MDIFNKIGKSISDGSRSAVQKTKDMTEIAKRNSSISEAQKQIQAYYQRLGAKYYQRCLSTGENLEDPDVQRVRELQGRIETWQAEIVSLRGIVNCPKCGGEVAVTSPFCQHCGAALHPAEKPQQSGEVCPSCGARVKPGSRFCISCGKPMELLQEDPAPPAEDPMTQAEALAEEEDPASAAQTGDVCPGCGAKIRPDDVFCQTCGMKMS